MRRGSPVGLFELAGSLDRVRSFDAATKSQCGYLIAGRDEPSSFKAGAIELKPDMLAAEAFQTIARACIRHFRLNEPLLIASRSAEPLHQARVAIRRLRAALSLFRPIARDQKYEWFKRGLSDIFHKLGEARDLDVYIAHIAGANADENEGLPPFALDPGERIRAERELAYQQVIAALESRRFHQFMLNLVTWIGAGPWCTLNEPQRRAACDQTIKDFAAHVLDRRWRKLKQRGRHLERMSPEARHRIRIDSKKLRYACEFFSSLITGLKSRKRLKAFSGALEFLQTCLGDLNDIQTRHEIATKLARPETAALGSTAGGPLNEQNELTTALLGSASKMHHQLLDTVPFWKD